MLYSTLLPQEVRIDIAGQVIYPYRAVAFVSLPWLLHRIVKGRFPYRPADLLMFVAAGWMVVSFTAFYGLADGLTRGGVLAFDMIAPYLFTRMCIRSFDDFRRLLVFAAPGLALAGLSMMVESITHQMIVRPAAAAIFGPLPYFENGQIAGSAKDFNVTRLGLLRAPGPFSHPILAGLYLASFVPLYYTSSLKGWPRTIGLIAGLLSFFSVSSATIISLVLSGSFLAYDHIQARLKGIGWRFALFSISALLLLIQVASPNGVVRIIIRYTLDPLTGYFRLLIWEYGTRSVARYPWFGIGFTDYERLSWMINSIDNHWLLLAVRHGFITPVALMASCIAAIITVSRAAAASNEFDRKLCVGLGVTLGVLIFTAFTTSFFGGMLTLFSMIIALCYSIAPVHGQSVKRKRLGVSGE